MADDAAEGFADVADTDQRTPQILPILGHDHGRG